MIENRYMDMVEEEDIETDELIGYFCFDTEDRLHPLHMVVETDRCDEYVGIGDKDIDTHSCLSCKRGAYIKKISNTICRMHAIAGYPITINIFNKYNKDYWQDTPKKDRIYSKSGKSWCRKTTKESSDKLFDSISLMKNRLESRGTDSIPKDEIPQKDRDTLSSLIKSESSMFKHEISSINEIIGIM